MESNHLVSKSKKKWTAVIVIIVVVILVCLGMGAYKMMNANAGIKTGQYQAVFLTNGQVYFCKLSNINEGYVTCNDIYYLQVQQTVQPAEKKDGDQPKVSLAKLGSELHGPEDQMHINREQVLFWENLKDSSKVVTAIKENNK